MSIGNKILQIDRRILYLILASVSILPLLFPIGLPIPVSDATQAFYDGLEAIPDGSLVVIDWEIRLGRPVWSTLMGDVFRYFCTRDIYVVHVSFDRSLEGGEVCASALRNINPEATYGKIYGVDYVNLGATPGQITSLAGFVQDAWNQYPTDNDGTPVQNLPIMERMRTGADIDAVVVIGAGVPAWWIGQLKETYDTPIFATADSGEAKQVQPYVESGQVEALLTDLSGAAEFELLMDQPGNGLRAMDPLNTILITEAVFLIITNVAYLSSDKTKTGVKEV